MYGPGSDGSDGRGSRREPEGEHDLRGGECGLRVRAEKGTPGRFVFCYSAQGMTGCGLVKRRMYRSGEESIGDFSVVQLMRGLSCDLLSSGGLVSSTGLIVMAAIFAGEVRREHEMHGATVHVARVPMVMVGLGMHVDQWGGKYRERQQR